MSLITRDVIKGEFNNGHAAHYRVIPDYITKEVKNRLDDDLLKIVEQFHTRYSLS